ncbi:MAG: hypothetical protein EBY76_11155, partial [Betaproteobacteria bacterium]|nr:hypothetical protein [Betaproteobacteria bacterium]
MMNTMMSFTTNPPKRAVSNFHRAYGFGIRWSKQVDFDPGVLLTDLEAEDLADESLALIEDLSKMAANHFQSSIGYTLYEPLATPSLAAFQHGWEFQRYFAIYSEKQQAQVQDSRLLFGLDINRLFFPMHGRCTERFAVTFLGCVAYMRERKHALLEASHHTL